MVLCYVMWFDVVCVCVCVCVCPKSTRVLRNSFESVQSLLSCLVELVCLAEVNLLCFDQVLVLLFSEEHRSHHPPLPPNFCMRVCVVCVGCLTAFLFLVSVCLSVAVCVSVCLHFCFLVCLFVCLFVCMFIFLSACLSVGLHVCFPECFPVFVCLFVCLFSFVCLFVCLLVCLFACLFSCLYLNDCSSVFCACLSACLHVRLSVCSPLCLCFTSYQSILLLSVSLYKFLSTFLCFVFVLQELLNCWRVTCYGCLREWSSLIKLKLISLFYYFRSMWNKLLQQIALCLYLSKAEAAQEAQTHVSLESDPSRAATKLAL